jgi:glycosyltransferase involved in cell wall biosynthesis
MPLEHRLEPKLYGPVRSLDLSEIIYSCKIVDRIVVNSEYMRSRVAAWYGINLTKIVVIPNGVDLSRFRGCNKLTLDGDPAILYLGGLTTRKGVDILFQAVAALRSELPDMKLHLVGGAGRMSYFQHLAENEGICRYVVFHGRVPDVMVPLYYKSADFCVFPSRHEPFGIVVLEAMASGIPIIASNIGGFGEIISNDQDGLLFKPGDAAALSKAILVLNKDLDLRRKLSQTASRTVERYSWEVVAEEYVSLYEHLCQR